MSTKFRAIKALENYSSQEFADFISKYGFPECKNYIVENEIVYSNFKNIQEIQLLAWKHAVDFSNFKNFCQFHQKLQTLPESFLAEIGTIININFPQKEQVNNCRVVGKNNTPVIPTTIILSKSHIPSKPEPKIKPVVSQKPNNFELKNIIHNNHTGRSSSNVSGGTTTNKHSNAKNIQTAPPQVNITEELIQKLAKVQNAVSKPLPIPPKAINIKTVPKLPDYLQYNSNPSSGESNANDIADDYDGGKEHGEGEDETMYNEPPDGYLDEENLEDDDATYCDAIDMQKILHSSSPISVPSAITPPQIDRRRMPKPPIRKPQIDRRNNHPNNRQITQQYFVNDEEDDEVHMYEVLPPSPKSSQPRDNSYSKDPTHMASHGAASMRQHDNEGYLEPRNVETYKQSTAEHSRPLPPTPVQTYTLDDLKSETYFRDVDRRAGEKILQTEPIGTFLVRPSKQHFCCFVIKSATKIFNIGVVKMQDNKFHLLCFSSQNVRLFHSITDMINCYIEEGISIPDGDNVTHMNLRNVLYPTR